MAAQVRKAGKRGVNAAVPLTGVGTLEENIDFAAVQRDTAALA